MRLVGLLVWLVRLVGLLVWLVRLVSVRFEVQKETLVQHVFSVLDDGCS